MFSELDKETSNLDLKNILNSLNALSYLELETDLILLNKLCGKIFQKMKLFQKEYSYELISLSRSFLNYLEMGASLGGTKLAKAKSVQMKRFEQMNIMDDINIIFCESLIEYNSQIKLEDILDIYAKFSKEYIIAQRDFLEGVLDQFRSKMAQLKGDDLLNLIKILSLTWVYIYIYILTYLEIYLGRRCRRYGTFCYV